MAFFYQQGNRDVLRFIRERHFHPPCALSPPTFSALCYCIGPLQAVCYEIPISNRRPQLTPSGDLTLLFIVNPNRFRLRREEYARIHGGLLCQPAG